MYSFNSLIESRKVTVPRIQRDYAQGRISEETIRNNFLEKIKDVLTEKQANLHLDFVYGYEENNNFIPLDGQQRLTTLFLLTWYLSVKDGQMNDELKEQLLKFTYETRLTSERFCEKLASNVISISPEIIVSDEIKNKSWFMSVWTNDPTVDAMLNMLDSIHDVFQNETDLYNKLKGDKITFKLIDIKSENFKLTDELYIKMNSRGKPLSDFENFKAEFSEILKDSDAEYCNETIECEFKDGVREISYQDYFSIKMDGVWTDLFWNHRQKDEFSIDGSLFNYFKDFSELLYYTDPKIENEETKDGFIFNNENLKKIYFKKKNILLLFRSLNFHAQLDDITEFYESIFCTHASSEKIRLFEGDNLNLFSKISDKSVNNLERFIYYSLILIIEKESSISREMLIDYLRVIRNVLLGVRQVDSKNRINFESDLRVNRLIYYNRFIDAFAENIINKNSIKLALMDTYDANYLKTYISLEKEKYNNFSYADLINLWFIENHIYIQGLTETICTDQTLIKKIEQFLNEVWHEDLIMDKNYNSLVSKAFLTMGDYSVISHSNSTLGNIKFFGTANYWRRIFSPLNDNDKNTIAVLFLKFLRKYFEVDGNSNRERLENIITDYIETCEEGQIDLDWRYYFIKYNEFLTTDINSYTWSIGGYDVNATGSTTGQPLSAYHFNPYLKSIVKSIKSEKVELNSERFSERSWIEINHKYYILLKSKNWEIGTLTDNYLDIRTLELNNVIEISENLFHLPIDENSNVINEGERIVRRILLID